MDNAALNALLVGYNGTFKDTLAPKIDTSLMELVSEFTFDNDGTLIHVFGPTGAALPWGAGADRPQGTVVKYSFEARGERYALSLPVDVHELVRNEYEVLDDYVSRLGDSAAISPTTLIATELISNKTGWDGKRLFANNHSLMTVDGAVIPGTTFSNQIYDPDSDAPWFYLFKKGSIAFGKNPNADFKVEFGYDDYYRKQILEVGYYWFPCVKSAFSHLIFRSNKPLTEDSLEELKSLANAVRGPSGMPMNNKPTHLLVPQGLEKPARDILERPVVDGSTNLNNGSLNLIVTPYLPDSFSADPALPSS